MTKLFRNLAVVFSALAIESTGSAIASANPHCEALLCLASKNPEWTQIDQCKGRDDFEGDAKYRGGPVYGYFDYAKVHGKLAECPGAGNTTEFEVNAFDWVCTQVTPTACVWHATIELKSKGKLLNRHQF